MQHATLTRRLLAVLLTLAMLFSFLVPAVSAAPAEKAAEPAEEADGLELTAIDPSTLNVHKLGEIENEKPEGTEREPFTATDLVRVSIVLEGDATLDRFPMKDVAANAEARS